MASAAPPLQLQPRFSPRLAAFIAFTHLLTIGSLVAVPLGLWRLPLLLAVLGSAWLAVEGHLLRRLPWAIRSACWQADDRWLLTLADGSERQARLSPATFVGRALVVVNLRLGAWQRRSLVLVPDALDADVLRRLRQRLRLLATLEEPQRRSAGRGAGRA